MTEISSVKFKNKKILFSLFVLKNLKMLLTFVQPNIKRIYFTYFSKETRFSSRKLSSVWYVGKKKKHPLLPKWLAKHSLSRYHPIHLNFLKESCCHYPMYGVCVIVNIDLTLGTYTIHTHYTHKRVKVKMFILRKLTYMINMRH